MPSKLKKKCFPRIKQVVICVKREYACIDDEEIIASQTELQDKISFP